MFKNMVNKVNRVIVAHRLSALATCMREDLKSALIYLPVKSSEEHFKPQKHNTEFLQKTHKHSRYIFNISILDSIGFFSVFFFFL